MRTRRTSDSLALVVTTLIVLALASCCVTSCSRSTAPAPRKSADSLRVRFDTSLVGRVTLPK